MVSTTDRNIAIAVSVLTIATALILSNVVQFQILPTPTPAQAKDKINIPTISFKRTTFVPIIKNIPKQNNSQIVDLVLQVGNNNPVMKSAPVPANGTVTAAAFVNVPTNKGDQYILVVNGTVGATGNIGSFDLVKVLTINFPVSSVPPTTP